MLLYLKKSSNQISLVSFFHSPLSYKLFITIFQIISKDVPVLRDLCGKHELPGKYRPIVWKILLGFLPPYRESWEYIEAQFREQYYDIKNSMFALITDGSKKNNNNNNNNNDIKYLQNDSNEGNDSSQSLEKVIFKKTGLSEKNLENMAITVTQVYNFQLFLEFSSLRQEGRLKRNYLDIAKIFSTIFSDEVDTFWCYRSFLYIYGSSLVRFPI